MPIYIYIYIYIYIISFIFSLLSLIYIIFTKKIQNGLER